MLQALSHMLRRIPNWAEATLVLGATFGTFIVQQQSYGTSPDVSSQPIIYTDELLMGLVWWEILILTALSTFLYIRGWRPGDVPTTISWATTKSGLKLWLLSYLIYFGIGILLMTVPVLEASAQNMKFEIAVTLPVMILLSIVNPIYEEALTVLYVARRMDWAQAPVFWITSASLRATVHAYQGAFAMTSIFVMGLLFAHYFSKKRQLWPIILAHALMDFLGLLMAGSSSV
jgi:uncharacterized protein